jgi:hypothetical protein
VETKSNLVRVQPWQLDRKEAEIGDNYFYQSTQFGHHVWRVFEGDKEYLVKHFKLNVLSESEKETTSDDWNVVCYCVLTLDRETSTAIIDGEKK